MQYALCASLDLIVYEEGLQNVIFWHHHLAEATCYYRSPLVDVEEVQCQVSQGVWPQQDCCESLPDLSSWEILVRHT
jgi:hypothetical protein